jgi:hypothetical protein
MDAFGGREMRDSKMRVFAVNVGGSWVGRLVGAARGGWTTVAFFPDISRSPKMQSQSLSLSSALATTPKQCPTEAEWSGRRRFQVASEVTDNQKTKTNKIVPCGPMFSLGA